MITVLAEVDGADVAETSLEALTFARTLAGGRGTSLGVVVIGIGETTDEIDDSAADSLARTFADYGATRVRFIGGPDVAAYCAAAYAAALVDAARQWQSDVVIASGTPRGTEMLAHAAVRLDAVMAANAVETLSDDPLVVSRQVMGGSILEDMRVDSPVAVLTVAGHAVEAAPAERGESSDSGRAAPEIERVEHRADPADLVMAMQRLEPTEQADTAALTGARVVVGAGRGVGGADEFDDVLELVDLLGGALGVSRVVTNLGWRPHHEQVGQTGSRISPDLYVACGISGAIQHLAGCSSARTIVAINSDADAPMVTNAQYAVIGDLHEIIPAVNEELRRRRG
ncbi:electron transfer flavoprotein subunit alpha/FixB family protein [Spelaeicoccus albus]|uniref:Electron transfer flavoprotein alpha subunit n=1 Tax=Spelaeicoccus albus TaxID=1280376 RepID=A0A7Z0D3Y7_9MICO|nr:electron transfer flavoprotein subunit alpha/FixB family protein [Spelaeicoccus albus]NYI68444.1 electron transfer flavoprotein alpha subunit [Spelaeicoccus albus]